jgi:hypothetical protein
MSSFNISRAVVLALGVAAVSAQAESDFVTSITTSVIHSDNITLAPPGGDKNSDTVLVLAPLFSFIQNTKRVQTDFSYNPQAIFYANTDDADEVFHVVDGTLTAELAQEFLFLDLSAAKFQTIVTPDGSFPIDNIAVSNNRADSTIIKVNPYLQRRFGDANLRIDLSHTRSDFDDESTGVQQDLQSNDENGAVFKLSNEEQRAGLTWSLDYRYQRVEYDEAIPWEYQRAGASLGFWVSDTLRIFGSGGQETAFDDFFTGKLEDDFWEAGFQLQPSSRLNFEIAAGERSFGSSVRSMLDYTTPKSRTSLTYSEEPFTQGSLLDGRRPIRDTDNLDGLLDQLGASDRMIRKRGELSTTIELPKTELTWRLFSERRTNQTTATGTPLPSEKLVGAAVRMDWRMGSRTNLFATLDTADREIGDASDDFWSLGVGVGYSLSERLSFRFDVQHIEQDGPAAVGFGRNYDVTRATLSATATL